MPGAIPLIRGFALLPTLHWLVEEGASIERTLAEVGLSSDPITAPFRPIPLLHAAALLRNAAREHGPDVPCRVLSRSGSLEIAMLGKVALGARTPAEALGRVVAALPYYCSHEQVSFERRPGQYVVREFFSHRFDPETRHLLLQYAAAMIDRILSMAGDAKPRIARIEIPPHPIHGVGHLHRWFGKDVVEAKSRGITLFVDDRVMERTFGKVARDRLNPRELDGRGSLRGETFSDSVKSLLGLMIESDEPPTMKRLVAAAGTSARTFQRQLEEEGTSFSELLADVRRSETLRRLKERKLTIGAIATDLGYSDQASFTRAFRRWTGTPPGQFRARTPQA
jgi:AraC-like DNA-binding protein